MEVFLAFTVIVVSLALLVVLLVIAATFRERTEKYANPLIKGTARELTDLIYSIAQEVHHRVDEVRDRADRASKDTQESMRSTGERLTRTAQRLEASQSATKVEINWSNQNIQEIQNRIEQLQAGDANAEQVMSAISRDIAQLQESIRQLSRNRSADKQVADALWRRVDESRDSVNRIAGRLTTAVSSLTELEGRLATGEGELGRISDFGQVIQRQLMSAIRQVDALNLEMDQVNLYVLGWLDRELSTANENAVPRIVTCGLSSDLPTAQIMWASCEALWEALSAKLLFRYPSSSPSASFYLLWDSRTRGSLPERMGALFQHCKVQAPAAIAGLRQLQSLLVVMYYGRPAVWRMGPALITRTRDELLAGILPEDPPAAACDLMSLDPEAWAAKLRELDQDSVVDLTAWAQAYAA